MLSVTHQGTTYAVEAPSMADVHDGVILEKMTGTAMVRLHNDLCDNPVNKFSDKQTAVRRTFKAIETWCERHGVSAGNGAEAAEAAAAEAIAACPEEANEVPALTEVEPEQEAAPEAVEPEPEQEAAPEPTPAEDAARPMKKRVCWFRIPPSHGPDGPKDYRPGTKRAVTMPLIRRPGGARFEEIHEALNEFVTGNGKPEMTVKQVYEGIRVSALYLGYGLWKETEDGPIMAQTQAEWDERIRLAKEAAAADRAAASAG